jgi:hypothetical protein
MSWRLLENDELTMSALSITPLDFDPKIIADQLRVCAGCVWWSKSDAIDTLFLFHTAIPVCDWARLLICELVLPLYSPPVNLVVRNGVPSGRYVSVHAFR